MISQQKLQSNRMNQRKALLMMTHYGNPSSQSVARLEQRTQGGDQVEAKDRLLADSESEPSESADEEYIWNYCQPKQRMEFQVFEKKCNIAPSFQHSAS
jgi:hypothetical protein